MVAFVKNELNSINIYVIKKVLNMVFNVILLLDGDEAGVKGTMKASDDMKGKIKLTPLFFPFEDKDPGDLSVDELRELLGGTNG